MQTGGPAQRLHRRGDRPRDRRPARAARPGRGGARARRARSDLAGRRVEACSGGEQQRLKFALALVPDPDLVVLDEPTTGMDVGARQEFWETMRADAALRPHDRLRHPLPRRGRRVRRAHGADEPRPHRRTTAATTDVRAAYGGRTLTFRPPADGGRHRRHRRRLARPRRAGPRAAGRHRPRGLRRQPRGRLPGPHRRATNRSEPHDDRTTTTATDTAGTTRVADGVRATPRPACSRYAGLDLRRQLRDRIGMFFIVGAAGVHVPRLRARLRRARRQRQRRDVRDGLDGGVRRGHGDHQRRRERGDRAGRWAGAASSASRRCGRWPSWRSRRASRWSSRPSRSR